MRGLDALLLDAGWSDVHLVACGGEGGCVFTVSVAREYANEGTEHLTQRGC